MNPNLNSNPSYRGPVLIDVRTRRAALAASAFAVAVAVAYQAPAVERALPFRASNGVLVSVTRSGRPAVAADSATGRVSAICVRGRNCPDDFRYEVVSARCRSAEAQARVREDIRRAVSELRVEVRRRGGASRPSSRNATEEEKNP